MKLIVGLGNPGKNYENTRHNIGFMVIDSLAKDFGLRVEKIQGHSLTDSFNYKGEKIILAKPQTYMNKSGQAVRALMDFYKIDPEDLIVVYDDIDLDFGHIRIKGKGSSGSHNGMKSIIQHLGDEGFPRVRISVGDRPSYMDLADFVLSKFSKKEKATVERLVEAGKEAALVLASQGPNAAMNKFNGMDFND